MSAIGLRYPPSGPFGEQGRTVRATEQTIRLPAPIKQARLMSESEALLPSKMGSTITRRPAPTRPVTTQPTPTPVAKVDPELAKRQNEDRHFLESLLGKVSNELSQMRQAADERLHQWQLASVELATALATQLLYREVEANEFRVEESIRTIVDELGDETPATIYLNPADLKAMQQRLGNQPLFPNLENPPTLIPTDAIARGDCKVQGRSGGELASEISERIALMREDLLEKLHART